MPEEFRLWKEKMDEVDRRKKSADSSKQATAPSRVKKNIDSAIVVPKTVIKYASHSDAIAAFNDMLTNKKITSSAKMKEVIDICQNDPRWNALPSQGEKKQTIAEYQVSLYSFRLTDNLQ